VALFSLHIAASGVLAADSHVRVNTVGFLPDRAKRASIAAPAPDFAVVDESGTVVLQGKTTGPVRNADTGEDLFVADFSALTAPGTYRLDVPGVGRSAPFRVAGDVFAEPFAVAVRAMYLWRCGMAVSGTHNGISYSHGACHLDDAWLDFAGGGHTRRDSTKGWHDAGDYNKYVVNAGVTVGTMLLAWEHFGPRIRAANVGLPDQNGLPAYLAEIKWETDWLLTMQRPDGKVYHKVSTRNFTGSGPPENERVSRYFAPWSSAATADFVAMTAMAAKAFAPYDAEYAARCLNAAVKSYKFLKKNPANKQANLSAFTTGAYQTDDTDDRLWAAAALWEATGKKSYLRDFETRARAIPSKIDQDWGWGNVKNLGMLVYLFSERAGRDEQLVRQIRNAVVATADAIVAARNAHGYARPLGTSYYWGCNGAVAQTSVVLQSANMLAPKDAYVDTSLDALGHLFGRNYFARSLVTGLGANPPNNPHDRRSMGQPGAPAWPGYVVGGGWPKATDWEDVAANYEVNEIAINWNAPFIYALASFLPES
jgi:endoglucanase